MVSAVCTDGAPALIRYKSGLRSLIKSDISHIVFIHCMLHKHALVSKTKQGEKLWLSRGKMMNRFFALRAELMEFLKSHNHRHSKHFKESSFILILAYLADTLGALNQLNYHMQGGGKNLIEAEKQMNAF